MFRVISRVKQLLASVGQFAFPPEGIADNVVAQKHLMVEYGDLDPSDHLSFRDVGWSLYSQHDEDGILLYIFSRIGVDFYRCIEMCVGTAVESNTANLIINHRWTGLLLDGNHKNTERAKQFYSRKKETLYWQPEILNRWITKDNVNEILTNAGYTGEVDLLSLDMDGIDFWVWKELSVVAPRVVVLEFNHLLGPTAAVTVPYDENFVAEFSEYGSDYAGASLAAFIKLGKRKGYRYVGSNTIGTNAFFLRSDISPELVPEADPLDAFRHPRARFGIDRRYPKIKNKPWVQV